MINRLYNLPRNLTGLSSDQKSITPPVTNSRIGNKITREDCIKWANDAQSAVTQYTFQDPQSGELRQVDWDFEIARDITSLSITQNENEYA